MSDVSSFSSVTYGGVAMTLKIYNQVWGQTQKWAVYGLSNPPTGNNNLVLTTGSAQTSSISMMIQSFTGSSGFGVAEYLGNYDSPNSTTLTVEENSIIYATAVSTYEVIKFVINGSDRGRDFIHNNGKQIAGVFSDYGLPAGAITVSSQLSSPGFSLTNQRVEIKEAATSNNAQGSFFF
jgi:hypothetical protein